MRARALDRWAAGWGCDAACCIFYFTVFILYIYLVLIRLLFSRVHLRIAADGRLFRFCFGFVFAFDLFFSRIQCRAPAGSGPVLFLNFSALFSCFYSSIPESVPVPGLSPTRIRRGATASRVRVAAARRRHACGWGVSACETRGALEALLL